MQKYIDYLIQNYNTKKIEIALIQLFIDINKVNVKNNKLILSILNNEDNEVNKIKRFLIEKNIKLRLFDLANLFELLIPLEDRKLNGAFFTPKFITDFISSQVIVSQNPIICDPSCGCGAFLISAAEFISKKYNKEYIKIIEENLFGVDIVGYSIERAKILLSILALINKEDIEEIKFNLIHDNSLEIKWEKKFDAVIGNPPYIKFQDLPEELRYNLFINWKTLKSGTYNLYFAFFELGINILKSDGILGYITPNNYFTSLAGIHLRKYFVSNRYLDKIIDFNHIKLFDAQTYTCITFLTRNEKDYFYYERIDDRKNLYNLGEINYSKVFFPNLNNKKWRLLRNSDQNNIKIIENQENRLSDIVEIRVGIATCKDSVYFIDGKTLKNGYYQKNYKDNSYLIEEMITKPITKISDFKNQIDLDRNLRRIIFPYKKANGKIEIIKEEELVKKFPKCYEYLIAARKELATRDKGKVEYQQWFAYARTQGLNLQGKKLLTPTFSAEPRFLVERNGESLFCNGYALYSKNDKDLFSKNKIPLEILAKILNSKIMDYYIKRTSVSIEGDYQCYQKNFIELFGIPDFSKEELDFLENDKNTEDIDKFLIYKYNIDI